MLLKKGVKGVKSKVKSALEPEPAKTSSMILDVTVQGAYEGAKPTKVPKAVIDKMNREQKLSDDNDYKIAKAAKTARANKANKEIKDAGKMIGRKLKRDLGFK
jgi:hypothetical protein